MYDTDERASGLCCAEDPTGLCGYHWFDLVLIEVGEEEE